MNIIERAKWLFLFFFLEGILLKLISLKLLRSLCVDFIIFLIPLSLILLSVPYVLKLLWPFIAAFFLYLAANPLNKALSRRKIPSSVSSFLSLFLISFVIFLVIRFLSVKLWAELRSLSENSSAIYNSYASSVSRASQRLFTRAQDFSFSLQGGQNASKVLYSFSEALQKQLGKMLSDLGIGVLSAAKNIPAILLGVFTTVFTTFFLLKEGDSIFNLIRNFFGEKVCNLFLKAKNTFFNAAAAFIKAQLIIEGIIFIILLCGFLMLKINYSFTLAFITALVDAVPVFGTGAILIPMALFNFLAGKTSLAWGILILYGTALLARQLCEPKIVGKKLGIHPLVTIFSIYVGMKLFGVLGLVLAPITTVFLKILFFSPQKTL